MAITGRPPKPVEQKRKAGNPGRRQLPVPVVTLPPVTSIPPCPEGLEPPGQRYWADVWVAANGWLSPHMDAPIVEMAARLWDEVGRYRELAKNPLLREPIVTPTGQVVGHRVVANPAVRLQRDAEKQLERWLVELGLTPSARARLGLVQVRAESKLDSLIAAREKRATARR